MRWILAAAAVVLALGCRAPDLPPVEPIPPELDPVVEDHVERMRAAHAERLREAARAESLAAPSGAAPH
jgi:hypothetical protein